MTMTRILLLALLLVASGVASARPKISLLQATRLAEAYIEAKKIPNRDRYLASVTWREDLKHPEESCWAIYWASNDPAIEDAQLMVWVYDNGQIRHQDSWA